MHHESADGDGNLAVAMLLWRSLAIIAAVTIVTAIFSDLYYFPDEHYQILEFMAYKLGVTQAADMPWEFAAHIRPWMQPFLYYLIAKPLIFLGYRDLFGITFLLRLVTGLFSVLALGLFARETVAGIEGEEEKRAFVGYLPWFGFLPYLFVRTASETVSAAFFTLSVALVMRSRSAARLIGCGLLNGLAFETRYQSAFLTLGLVAWLAVIGRVRAASLAIFAGAALIPIAVGAFVDRWGYGLWCFPPWGYFKANILDGVAAKTFGTQPFFAYIYLMPAGIFLPITLVVMVAMVAMFFRNPRHIATWVTLPFVLIHMAVGHKEARFMFPLAIIATSYPVLGFSPRLPRWREWAARQWAKRRGWGAKFVTAASVAAMAFYAVYPFGIRPHMPMARYVYENFPAELTAYSFDKTLFESYPMYRPPHFASLGLTSEAQFETLLDKGPVFLFSNVPTPPEGVIPAGANVTMLYSEFPLASFGYGETGTRYLRWFARFETHARFLRMLPPSWITLYRVARAPATKRS